jgi:aspartyl-tRNA(Asn)/glutamyl-tRNA(Gln) amidotransferase subunit C
MPVRLSADEVRHVAELAKLRLSDAEIEQYAEHLQEVDTSSVPPTPYILPLVNVMREDVPQPSLTNAEALANAPDSEDGFFRVRAVFEE